MMPVPPIPDHEIARMRRASGAVDDARPIVSFVYVLLRDILSPGNIENIINSILRERAGGTRAEFQNGWLAAYAQDIVARLVPPRSPGDEGFRVIGFLDQDDPTLPPRVVPHALKEHWPVVYLREGP